MDELCKLSLCDRLVLYQGQRKRLFPGHTVGVQVQLMFCRRHRLAAAVAAAAILTASCSGGARPTLTSDRLVEPSEAVDTATFEPASAGLNTTTPAPNDGAPDNAAGDASEPQQLAPGEVERLLVQVLETFPHDPTAFTQGLELDNGVFLESTGSRGPGGIQVPSTLRRVDPATGNVEQLITLDQQYFGEGLTKVGNELIQLTWKQNTAFYWDAETFELNKQVSYDGQGWGLCYDGSRLVMTDGTVAELMFRDPVTFEENGRVPVTFNDQQVFNLNELECVDGFVWANIWQTDLIVRIDPSTGAVNGVADAVELGGSIGAGDAVLNGIAWDSSTGSFYVTGKLWPTMFRVNFAPAPTS
jgi:glutamine cyclotransferase